MEVAKSEPTRDVVAAVSSDAGREGGIGSSMRSSSVRFPGSAVVPAVCGRRQSPGRREVVPSRKERWW